MAEGRAREDAAGAASRHAEESAPEQRIEVDGVETVYRREGSGETVLFLHGSGLSRKWLPFHAELAERYDVIAPQHPGYGGTPLPEHFRSFDDYALHYDAFLRALDLERVHLVGTSLGGRIAAHLATFYPERFASLTLIVPAGLRGDASRPDPFRQTAEEAVENLTNERSAQIPMFSQGIDDHEQIIEAYREDTTLALLTFTDRYDRKLPHRLGRIAAPALVIDAEEDRVLGPGAVRQYASLIPRSKYTVIAGPAPAAPSSHILHVEQPSEVVAALVRHLESAAPQERQ